VQGRSDRLSCNLLAARAPRVVQRRFERLRAILLATDGDRATDDWRAAALRGERPDRSYPPAIDLPARRRFVARARAGLGGVSDDGNLLAFHIAERGEIVPVVGMLLLYPRPIAPKLSPYIGLGVADASSGPFVYYIDDMLRAGPP
jgi:hypothetical protein